MKKVILAASTAILIALFTFFYKIGEDMMSMTRCGCK